MSKLIVKDLSHAFHKKYVIKNINLEINEGESIAILGPNGSGKTTLLRILATLLRPTKGKISYFDNTPQWQGNRRRQHLGALFADDFPESREIHFYVGFDQTINGKRVRFGSSIFKGKWDHFSFRENIGWDVYPNIDVVW